jgi:predicted RNA binding protein YcfA (HicA-like mRNA interferase family)
MTNLPALSGKDLIKFLKKQGFVAIRTKGSHHFLQHSDGRSTTVPTHSNETIGTGLLLKILKDCEIDKNDFIKMI